jgi:drug/metabolite transporter (DMT)-like permease
LNLPDLSHHLIGGSFALSAALVWAVASIIWRKLGDEVSPLGMNLGKGLVSLVCFAILFMAMSMPSATPTAWLLLGLSGLIGISLGDTVYFTALMKLGPRRILLMTALTPLLASAMAIAFLGERPNFQWVIGAALCLGGVVWVMWERLPGGEDLGSWRTGIWLGLAAACCEAVGNILTKVGLDGAGSRDATFIRLLFGTGGLLVFGIARGQLKSWVAPFKQMRLLGVLIAASLLGTFLGIWFATASLAYTHVSLATLLKSTSPIFVLPLAWLFMKEKLSLRAITGAVVAVIGVALLMTAF